MVCHLSGTAQLGALNAKAVAEWLDWHEKDRRGEIKRISKGTDDLGLEIFEFATREDHPPKEWLADAKELFLRLHKAKKRCELGAGAILTITSEQRRSFARLHSLRNSFAHFTPKGWAIELSGLPKVFYDVAQVIDLIAADTWAFRHMESDQVVELNDLLFKIKTESRAIDLG